MQMNLNIFQAIHNVGACLDSYFKASPFVFKSSSSVIEYSPALPTIYEFCVPPSDRNQNGYPINCPAIAIIIEDLKVVGDERVARIGLHSAVCNPAISDREIAKGNNVSGFTLLDSENYTQESAYLDLYAASLHLGEECLYSLESNSDKLRINNLTLTPPDLLLNDFPYSTCIVTCDLLFSRNYKAYPNDISIYL